MLRLSIIVPFYNVEKYIEECIRSLYDQDIPQEEYEVICVDDCSPDGSRAIVERLQKEYKTLRLVCHERNKKLGGARNTGLREAKGRYVWFVDSDDYVTPNCLGKLLREAEAQDAEMLLFDYATVTNGKSQQVVYPKIEDRLLPGDELLRQVQERWYVCVPTAWNKLYKREFLMQNGFLFTEDVMYEDTDLSLKMLTYLRRIKYINVVAYNYRQNAQSITNVRPTPEKMAFTIMQQNRCAIVAENTDKEIVKDVIHTYVKAQLSFLRIGIKELSFIEKRKYVNQIRRVGISYLKPYCTWRTWLAIRFGITWFV